jgi:hypothetical protein
MNRFDIFRLLGITLSFVVLMIILSVTFGTSCFSFFQLTLSYLLLIYTIIVEIISLVFRK